MRYKFQHKLGLTLAGDGGPLKKYNVLINLPKSQPCLPVSATTGPLYVFQVKKVDFFWYCNLSLIWRKGLESGEDNKQGECLDNLPTIDDEEPCSGSWFCYEVKIILFESK